MAESSLSALLWAQYETLCKDRLFDRADRLKEILRYLLENAENKVPLTDSIVAMAIYKTINQESEATVRASLREIRRKLDEYYARIETAQDPVIIKIEKGYARAIYYLRSTIDSTKSGVTIRPPRAPRLGRIGALIGSWRGQGGDAWVENSAPSFLFDVEATFEAHGLDISGHFKIRVREPSDPSSVGLALRGAFYDDDLIQTSYESIDEGRKQAGVALLKLSGDGMKIHALYSAFSPMRDCLIAGTIRLTKNNPSTPP
jgi:hypothetical protein